jgi:uncharacterized membrane protein
MKAESQTRKANIIFALFICLACVILIAIPTGFENPSMLQSTLREKARVLEVNNDDLQVFGVVTTGSQSLSLKMLSGPFKGDTVKAENILMGQMKIDKIFSQGDKVLTLLQLNKDQQDIISARAEDIYRINYELILFLLFALFLISFARWTGFKALISFVFTALAIWNVLIPLFLKGVHPIPISLIIVSATTSVIILLISGFTKKGLVALSGSVAGITITSLLSISFGRLFKIPGTVQEFSETLLYAGFTHLSYSDMFLAAIFISAAGAVMDVAMDIAASQNELIEKKPTMKTRELITSGFNIAYPVIGTMTTTLLFAYSGSFLFVFMMFMAKGTPFINIVNYNFIAAEILHTLVGSFGLVLVAPVTAVIGGYVYSRAKS